MTLTIGQVAKAADVNTETIRYYEREGLLPQPPRTPAGFRQYTDDAIRRRTARKDVVAEANAVAARIDALEDDA